MSEYKSIPVRIDRVMQKSANEGLNGHIGENLRARFVGHQCTILYADFFQLFIHFENLNFVA